LNKKLERSIELPNFSETARASPPPAKRKGLPPSSFRLS
jgi:hypothetical protein